MSRDYFLGIDIGTGSSKGVITDINGNIMAQHSIAHGMESPRPGWFEQDADDIWWGDFVFLAKKLTSELGEPAETIRSVAVSTIAPCVLPVDDRGAPLRKGILYGIDTRASAEIAELEELIGREEIYRLTAQELSSQACCPKILWLKKNEPEVWKKTKKIVTAAGYIVYKLTGRYTLDVYDGIGYAPLFDIRNKCWDSSYIDAVMDAEMLPELLWSSEQAGVVGKTAAEITGLAEGTVVITGTADAAAEAVGAGVCRDGDMMMMYGSSNFFILRTGQLSPHRSLWASNFMDEGTSVLTGGMTSVGTMFKWFSDTFPGRSFEEWEDLAATAYPGAGGVTVLPYLAGERTPINDPRARAAFFGLTLQTNPGDLWKALQEAVGCGIRHNLEVMKAEGIEAKRIMAIGGASESRSLLQTVSDVTGVSQFIPDKNLGACYGDAFLAAVGAGYFDSSSQSDRWVKIDGEISPNKHFADLYDEKYLVFRDLYESTAHLN